MMVGFSRIEIARLGGCLDRLTPHLRMNRIALAGGVGMQMGLAALGHPGVRHGVADLDLVATSLDAVSSSVVDRFLLSHYHVERIFEILGWQRQANIRLQPTVAGAIMSRRG
jgi:hypothetical protein